jgi:hypothetical protein
VRSEIKKSFSRVTRQTAALEALGPIAQSRLERTPDKREVVGSIPTRPTKSKLIADSS